jgi:hypothetical protein
MLMTPFLPKRGLSVKSTDEIRKILSTSLNKTPTKFPCAGKSAITQITRKCFRTPESSRRPSTMALQVENQSE